MALNRQGLMLLFADVPADTEVTDQLWEEIEMAMQFLHTNMLDILHAQQSTEDPAALKRRQDKFEEDYYRRLEVMADLRAGVL